MNYPLATVAVVIISVLLLRESWARSSGAPAQACPDISPVGHGGIAGSQDLTMSPYTLDISAFADDSYTPEETYTLTLSGTNFFRGLLVQARSMADDSPVGSFTAGSGTRLSSCPRADSAITHSNPSNKNSVELEFTAPPAGTGPLRFLYAVVQIFSTYYATPTTTIIDEEIIEEVPLELCFTGDTPVVTGNDISVSISVSSPVPLRCELVTRGEPKMPNISDVQNCTNGQASFINVEKGEHRVRVIAGDSEAVIRSRVILMPDNPYFCSLNAINKGITRVYSTNGTLVSYIIEFRPIGFDAGFICYFGSSPDFVPCSSPLAFEASDDVMRVKVVPDFRSCPGARRPLVFKLK